MSTYNILKDAPAAGVQKNANFQQVGRGTASESANSGTRDAKKKCVDKNDPLGAINALLGDVQVTDVGSRNLDLYAGYPHTTTGIPYAIQGSAKVISVNVGEYLASFEDPIKAILSTNIHKESRVVITRKYVVGGRAMITPEHAPARTVAIQEDVREINLTRYGGDIEMNLNLFLRPAEAKEELEMKVGAQRRELERVLVDMGYEMLMTQGTDLVDAIIRSSPLYSAQQGTATKDVIDAAERINVQTVFGSMSKHSYPVQNLLAAAKYASSYTTSNEKGSVLLLPHGLPDILRYTRQENMVYDIAGPALMQQTNGKPISMQIERAYTDPSTSVRILIHRQMPTFEAGVAHPDVPMGGLTTEASFANFYELTFDDAAVAADGSTDAFVTDFETGATRRISMATFAPKAMFTAAQEAEINAFVGLPEWGNFSGAGSADDFRALAIPPAATAAVRAFISIAAMSTNPEAGDATAGALNWLDARNYGAAVGAGGTAIAVRPQINALMSSAILAAPGEDTGSLLIGYPFTSVSTSSQEIVKIQMRTYLGSVLRKPENVIVIRNVFFEGLQSGHKFGVSSGAPTRGFDEGKDLYKFFIPDAYFKNHNTCINLGDFAKGGEYETDNAMAGVRLQMVNMGLMDNLTDKNLLCGTTDDDGPGFPARWYRGTTYDAADKVIKHNCGHMGELDHYRHSARLFGAQVYNSDPNPKGSRR